MAEQRVFTYSVGSYKLRFDLRPKLDEVLQYCQSLLVCKATKILYLCQALEAELQPSQTQTTHSYINKPWLVFGQSRIRKKMKADLKCFRTPLRCYRFPPPLLWVLLSVSREETGLLYNKRTDEKWTASIHRLSPVLTASYLSGCWSDNCWQTVKLI